MRTHGKSLSLCSLTAFLALGAGTARAQEATPAAAETAPAPRHRAASSSSSSGAGLGVGAAAFVSGMAGPQVVYDAGPWHAEGLLGFEHHTDQGMAALSHTSFDVGVSGWYHLHVGDSSDFSVGGGMGFMVSSPSTGNSATAVVIEPGVQARAFLTSNFALHARMGLGFVFGDNITEFGLGGVGPRQVLSGEITSLFGFTYFFR
jgi:hypothetical protein